MTFSEARRDDALVRSEQVFRLALSATGSLGYEWNVGTDRVDWFGDVEGALGLEPSRLPRTLAGWQAVIHPDDLDRVMSTMMAAVNAGARFDVTYRVLRADGQIRTWRDQGAPLDDAGATHPVIVGACTDVTEQLRTEELLRQSQKLEAVGLLAGGIAHDFNNVLSVIQGYGELLRDEFDDDEPGAELVDVVMQATRRASTLTQQLLTFSRRQLLQPGTLDLRAVVTAMQGVLRHVLGDELTLTMHAEPDTPLVHVDLGQLEEIVMNLAVNAREAMHPGGTLQLHTGRTDRGWAFLEVRDNGRGIAPEVLARIFEPFYSTKTSGRGAGLGLSTVHGIVHQSGGTIAVQSTVGMGSTFRVELPPVASHAPGAEPPVVSAPASQSSAVGTGELILLVDDEPVVATLIQRLLRDVGYEVLLAGSMTDALRELAGATRAVDLVLTDMIMPGGSGHELAAQLALTHPHVPVLFMSGHTAEMLQRRGGGLRAEMAFLKKPFTQATLVDAVRATIARGPAPVARTNDSLSES
jgi:PAS domain S-box-containing protein